MRLLLDTNVLLGAAFGDAGHHEACLARLHETLRGTRPWCLTWVNIYEFVRVATHRRVFPNPMTFDQAWRKVGALLGHPALDVLTETPRHAAVLSDIVQAAGPVSGNFIHDCHIAALMKEHDVNTIVTLDSHFRRFGLFDVVAP